MLAEPDVFPATSEMSSEFGDRLKKLRMRMNLTQTEMGAELGIVKNYVWQLESGTKEPGPRIVMEVERLESSRTPLTLEIKTPSVAAKITESLRNFAVSLRYIPVVSMAVAGRAYIAFEDLPSDWQDRIPTDVSDPKAFAVEVRGDSMEPHIRERDRVILLPSQEPHNGDIVVACLKNGDILLKLYLESDKGKTVHLSSYNPEYVPKTYKRSEFARIVPVDSVVKKVRYPSCN